jgi:DNA-binding transcriptional ArsR family regulator
MNAAATVEESGGNEVERTADVDRVIGALADPTRRQILHLLGTEGRGLSASTLAGQLPVSRQAVAQHLGILQQAALVSSERSGREVLFHVQASALEQTASWMTRLADTWAERLQLLKRIAEAKDPTQDEHRTHRTEEPN